MVITVNICKIGVHSHKSYIVYIKLCKVCLITFAYRKKMHICHIYLSCSPQVSILYQPVVGIFGKFPNWHLIWSKFWLLIGNLWATIEILISAPLVNQSLFFLQMFRKLIRCLSCSRLVLPYITMSLAIPVTPGTSRKIASSFL